MSLKQKYSKVFLTGATGWLGLRLAQALTQGNEMISARLDTKACDLSCLVPPDQDLSALKALGANIITGDITNPSELEHFLSDSKNALVLHVAGIIHPSQSTCWFDKINFEGTRNMLNAATAGQAKRLVVMSSNSPMGINPHPEHKFTEESPYSPYMGYGKSKHKMELMLREAMQQEARPEITIIRAPWFYGPGQPPRQTQFFNMIKEGKFPLMGKAQNKRSMAFIDSLTYGILLAADSDAAINEIFWIADEKPYSMLEIVNTVKDVLEKDFGISCSAKNLHVPAIIADLAEYCDYFLQKVGVYNQKIHVLSEMNKTIACDISKAKEKLNYQPLVELREGMKQSIQWCLNNKISIK